MRAKEYTISIDPGILELLGPSLYTNIYYVLAELIANAYDADAHNVYIIDKENEIVVEDDGKGMSYEEGEIANYLEIARVSRSNEKNAVTDLGRKKMGRKGVGKLAALSVSEKVYISTVAKGEKSGFVLSRTVNVDRKLQGLSDEEIKFEKIAEHGTSILMAKPQYKLHSTLRAIKRNLLKIFPMVGEDFSIHIIRNGYEEVINSADDIIINELATVITLGEEFSYLTDKFITPFKDNVKQLCYASEEVKIDIKMVNCNGEEKEYTLTIKGWIGTYKTTKGRKAEIADFQDNYISLMANKKMGEFNILPVVGQNKMTEMYIVGQLHVDLFELTELPDMALSNRQGYKSDDLRYQKVIEYVRNDLLPQVFKMRDYYTSLTKKQKEMDRIERQKRNEEQFRKDIENFRARSTEDLTNALTEELELNTEEKKVVRRIIRNKINENSPEIGIKSIVEESKKKILISHTAADSDLADVIFKMLEFNGCPVEDIIYTSCQDRRARIPETFPGQGIYEYLKDFFVNSYSTIKPYVIFVTSNNMKTSWGALTEVGASWIIGADHKIFNIQGFVPKHPLDISSQWHESIRKPDGSLMMSWLECDKFAEKIRVICDYFGYKTKSHEENKEMLVKLIAVE